MNLKISLRLGRILVVLALIVALLGSSIPVPARAVGFVPGLYDIVANIGVNAALRAIGVGPGNSPDAFNQLLTDATNNLFEGLSPLTQVFLDYTANGFRAFLSADFLSRLLTYMYSSRVLSSDSNLSTSHNFTWHDRSFSYTTSTPTICCLRYSSLDDGTGDFSGSVWLYGSSSFIVNSLNRSTYSSETGLHYYRVLSISRFGSSTLSSFPGPVVEGMMTMESFESSLSSVSTEQDLTLDSVGASLSAPTYSDWTAGAITQEDQPFVPVSIPSVSDSTAIFAQTQAQAQAGTIPETVVDEIVAGAVVVPETGTIADVITAVRALSADIVAAVQAIPAAIADIFSPAADPEVYQVDLKDFFPFCIPFDLFDIVTAFAAEPEAPVFEWPISVPRWGFEYTLKVDLQEWEDIASLFRTLELTIFCVGLAIVTREKFLRS